MHSGDRDLTLSVHEFPIRLYAIAHSILRLGSALMSIDKVVELRSHCKQQDTCALMTVDVRLGNGQTLTPQLAVVIEMG